jgi:two-component system, OmpR family, phosphate regulon sensor histidine kinase PhoR
MIHNANPKQISFWAAIFITLVIAMLVYCLASYFQFSINGFFLFNLFIFLLLINYSIIYYFIKNFVYKRIRILYKTIQKQKGTPESLKKDDDDEIFQNAENDILRWVVDSQNQIQTLQTLEEYRRNFVGNVSHELRTPIFNIQGFLMTLLDGGLEDADLTQRYVQKAAQNAERLQVIVNDLETIAKLESGKTILHLSVFDIKILVETVFDDLDLQAKEKNIRLTFKEEDRHNYKVQADQEQIRRVLENLIKNSIKYGAKNGSTRIGFYEMDDTVLVEVADNGQGISPEHLPYLFDRFYRVDKGRSRNEGGSGLGLSIVKHILEAHQQSINVRSTLNVGTTFGFTLKKA